MMDQQNFEATRPASADSVVSASLGHPGSVESLAKELGLKLGDQNELTIRRVKRGKSYSFVRANGTAMTFATTKNGTTSRAERLTGGGLADAVGQPLSEVFQIVDALTRAPLTSPVDRVMQARETIALPRGTALIARDGREHVIADSAAPIRHAGGPIVGVRGCAPGERDIPLEALVVERAVSVNTAAAGGNASLMTIG